MQSTPLSDSLPMVRVQHHSNLKVCYGAKTKNTIEPAIIPRDHRSQTFSQTSDSGVRRLLRESDFLSDFSTSRGRSQTLSHAFMTESYFLVRRLTQTFLILKHLTQTLSGMTQTFPPLVFARLSRDPHRKRELSFHENSAHTNRELPSMTMLQKTSSGSYKNRKQWFQL